MTPTCSLVALFALFRVQALDVRHAPTSVRPAGTEPADVAALARASRTVGAEPRGGVESPASATVPLAAAKLPAAVAESDEAQVRQASRGVCTNLKWGTLIGLAFLNAFGFFAKSSTGFGENILVQVGWHLLALCHVVSGNLVEIVLILTASNIPIMAAQTWLQRRHCNLPLALVQTATSLPPAVAGVAILEKFQMNVWLTRALAIVLLFVVFWFLFTEESECCGPASERSGEAKNVIDSQEDGGAQPSLNSGEDDPPESKPQRPPYATFGSCAHFWVAAFWGFLSGLLGGLFATTGPPLMVFVLCERIPKDEWRGTGALTNVINLIVRLAALIGFSFLGDTKRADHNTCMHILDIVVSIVFGLVGLCLGNCATGYINDKWFRRTLMLLLFVGGITMLAKT